MPPVLVSSCLLGIHSRYDGGTCADPALIARLQSEGCQIVPICPEQLGGLPTPRLPAQIDCGDGCDVLAGRAHLRDADGRDVTAAYLLGAREAVETAARCGCRRACLKERSPACGVRWIKRGEKTEPGTGVAAAALRAAGIEVTGVEPGE